MKEKFGTCSKITVGLVLIAQLLFVQDSKAQKSDTIEITKSIVENVELQNSISIFIEQEVGSSISSGAELSGHLRLFKGLLRIGVEFGVGKYIFNYAGSNPFRFKSVLNTYGFGIALLIGTDFFPKRKLDIILCSGFGILIPFDGDYRHDSYEYSNTRPVHYLAEVKSKVYPTVTGKLSFRHPIGKRSILSLGYGYSSIFGTVQAETRRVTEWPSDMGMQHQIIFSYCHYIRVKGRRR